MKLAELLGLFNEGNATAKSHMKNLLEVAMADGQFDSVEYNLLKKLARKYHITEKELENIRENPIDIEFEVPEDDSEKFEQFYELIHMMIIDEQIHPDEENLCVIFARKFRYPNVREVIKATTEYINKGLSHEKAKNRLDWLL